MVVAGSDGLQAVPTVRQDSQALNTIQFPVVPCNESHSS